MKLRDVGEFGLIARIERAARRAGRSGRGGRGGRTTDAGVSLSIGDDAALLRVRPGEELAVSTDAFVEDVHFRFSNESPRTIGRRAVAASLSDLAAMGARPLGCTLSLAAPPDLDLRAFDGLVAGVAGEGARHGAPLVGGNLARARQTQLVLGVMGAVARGRAMTRTGTRAGDRVFVTGVLGASALARLRAEREGTPVRRVPVPRLDAGRRLARVRGLVACIDVSDGLRADLAHLLGPRLALDLDPARLPLARGLASGARRLRADPAELALSGGEDYELLFAVRGREARAPALARRLSLPVRELGTVTRRLGRQRASEGGWRHF